VPPALRCERVSPSQALVVAGANQPSLASMPSLNRARTLPLANSTSRASAQAQKTEMLRAQ